MTSPLFNLYDLQLVHHLEQSKMATKVEMNRLTNESIDSIYSKVFRDIELWFRNKNGQSWVHDPYDQCSIRQFFPTFPVPPPPVNITQISLPDEFTNVQSHPMSIKHEIEATEPVAECPLLRTLLSQTENEQSNNAQSEVIGDSLGQATQPNQVTNHDHQYITLSLRCPESNCWDTFAGDDAVDELNNHLRREHSIHRFRCFVKGCVHQSFDSQYNLHEHIKHVHQSTTEWHCGKCAKHYHTYHQLSNHNTQYHQLGHFQCSFPACTFTAKYRMKVYSHCAMKHRPTLCCEHSGCQYKSSIPTNLKVHQRTHSGNKPYRCKWPQCGFAGRQKGYTINHIQSHFVCNPNSVSNGAQLDPSDFLEVVLELL